MRLMTSTMRDLTELPLPGEQTGGRLSRPLAPLLAFAGYLAVAVQLVLVARDHRELVWWAFDEAATRAELAVVARTTITPEFYRAQARGRCWRTAMPIRWTATCCSARSSGWPCRRILPLRSAPCDRRCAVPRARVSTRSKASITGHGTSMAHLGGAFLSDMMLIGDLRDLGRQGLVYIHGDEVDTALVALSAAGLGLTVGTLASGGASAPARFGASLIKSAIRSGHLSKALMRDVGRTARHAPADASWQWLTHVGTISTAVGPAASLRLLRHAETVEDIATISRLAPILGKHALAFEHALGKRLLLVAKSTLKLSGKLLVYLVGLLASLAAMLAGLVGNRLLARSIARIAG